MVKWPNRSHSLIKVTQQPILSVSKSAWRSLRLPETKFSALIKKFKKTIWLECQESCLEATTHCSSPGQYHPYSEAWRWQHHAVIFILCFNGPFLLIAIFPNRNFLLISQEIKMTRKRIYLQTQLNLQTTVSKSSVIPEKNIIRSCIWHHISCFEYRMVHMPLSVLYLY